jgi:hypothetical protein
LEVWQQSKPARDIIVFEHQWGTQRGLDLLGQYKTEELKRRPVRGFERGDEDVCVKNDEHNGIIGDTGLVSTKMLGDPGVYIRHASASR